MADVAAEGKTVQLMLSPVDLPPGKGDVVVPLPQSTAVMAIPMVEHMKKTASRPSASSATPTPTAKPG